MKNVRLAFAAALAAAVLALASRASAAPEAEKPTPLDALKKLAGGWESEADKDGNRMVVSYRLTGGGSAVEETLFPGTPKEMLTLYTMDGDDLVLTHYCMLGNQPHMKAKTPIAAGKIDFEYVSGGNMKSRDEMHMDSLTMTFPDADHLNHEWRLWEKGQVVKTIAFSLARKK